MGKTESNQNLPTAELKAERRVSWFWILPIVAVILVMAIGVKAWKERGYSITVHLDRGFGLSTGDDVRYRGIVVGTINSVELADNLQGVSVKAALHARGAELARAGARFWVVRPQVGISGASGLETLIGPRFLAALPGSGERQKEFVGLNSAPFVESIELGDLEIVLEAQQRNGLCPGAPVLYRQVPIGTVLSVGLAGDGSAVEARVHIQMAYTQLIRNNTRFWNAGGIKTEIGITGLSLGFDSLETLINGGIALATPESGGEIVRNGHRFKLATEAEDSWLEWKPLIAIGSSQLPPGSLFPKPMRAVVGWEQGRWIKSERTRRGWVLQTEDGLLGPADLLTSRDSTDVDKDSVVLEVAGQSIPLKAIDESSRGQLACIDATVSKMQWPRALRRMPEGVEDCLAISDPNGPHLPLSANRLKAAGNGWRIDPAVSIDESWHGACVLAREDGKLVGMIVVGKDGARVVFLPQA